MNETLLRNKGLLNYGSEVPDNDCDKAIVFGCYAIRPETLNAYRAEQADNFEAMLTMAWNEGTIAQLTVAPNSEGVGFRSTQIGTGKWLPWKQLATAEPPQKYELPLAEGITSTGRCYYCKTQENVVIVKLMVQTADTTGGIEIGHLPESFLPPVTIVTPAANWSGVADVAIDSDGTIRCYTEAPNLQVSCNIIFLAV